MHFDFSIFTHSFIALVTAFLLGSAIGYERQVRQRTAGLRTNALVAVGAAAFVDLAMRLGGNDGATHVVAYVVSGVGFLGAGTIMKEGLNVRGLNTAATLWGSAAAEPHKVAAVFRPRTFSPSFMMVPAPRKPTPDTT